MTDILFKGTVVINDNLLQTFIQEFDDLLKKYQAIYTGTINYRQFDECEVIETLPND